MISSRERIRIYRRWIWVGFKERIIDLGYLSIPVFTMTGVIAVCAKFWMWVLGI